MQGSFLSEANMYLGYTYYLGDHLGFGTKMTPKHTVCPKKYAHGFCIAVLCCGYTLTDFPISIRLNSLALWQSNDCPCASKATLMNIDKYFMWIHYERLHNHNKAKHNKTVCIFLGIYCKFNTRNGFVALKLVGLEILHKFLCYIGQNLEIPYIQDVRRTSSWITEKPTHRMTENHRFWTLGTFKQLS